MSQQELIVFLYESSLTLMDQARERIAANDVPGTHEKLDRCRNIFLHLLSTLNLEDGGELAQKLSSLYAYFIEKITMANVTKNAAELDDIAPLITNIKDAWAALECVDGSDTAGPRNRLENCQAISVEV